MRTLLNILCICLLAGFAGAALAQTPDGEPPAVETICNDLNFSGASFGLCNAYCEAMDCDCPTNGDPQNPNCLPNASPRACERVLANFNKKEPGVILVCTADEPQNFSLEIVVSGEGNVTSDIAGDMAVIDCPDGGNCIETYVDGTDVELTAMADTGWSFDGWGGDCPMVATSPITVTMDQNRTCTATFSEDPVVPEPCPCDGLDFSSNWVNDPTFTIRGNWDVFHDGLFSGATTCTDSGSRIVLSDPNADFGGGATAAVNYGSPDAPPFQCEVSTGAGTASWPGLTPGQALGCRNDLKTHYETNIGPCL